MGERNAPGKIVYIKITPYYLGSSKRPNNIHVSFSNGSPHERDFLNASKGKHHGKYGK
ncbi:MAG: hypothetical protein JWO65_1572 [Sphingomonas bacterium]|nr:hypothetical protein [Sphingomonas bacterium]